MIIHGLKYSVWIYFVGQEYPEETMSHSEHTIISIYLITISQFAHEINPTQMVVGGYFKCPI